MTKLNDVKKAKRLIKEAEARKTESEQMLAYAENLLISSMQEYIADKLADIFAKEMLELADEDYSFANELFVGEKQKNKTNFAIFRSQILQALQNTFTAFEIKNCDENLNMVYNMAVIRFEDYFTQKIARDKKNRTVYSSRLEDPKLYAKYFEEINNLICGDCQ